MSLTVLQSYNGIIRFYDGTVIAIEDQEYSADGKYNWEKIFNPNSHLSTLDGVTVIDGHRYKRVKHSGDTNYQLPYKIIPDEPVFRVSNLVLQYKLETEEDTEYKDLLDLSELQGDDGEKGETGIPGEGWHIDTVGYITTRPNCCGNEIPSSGCQSCNTSTNDTSYGYSTFLSLGDGNLILTSALISAGSVVVDSVTYTYFSNDLITWTAISSGIIDFQARYLATSSTGAVYTDMRTENYYSSRGVVYVCADGVWTILTNVATPSYMVGERAGSSNIGFVNNFIDDTLLTFIPNTVGMNTNGILEIGQESLDNTSFTSNVFGYGLDYSSGSAVEVDPSDFIGFGLTSYIADSDSKEKIQVAITDLLGDGTISQSGIVVDGETHNLIGINVNDIINNDSGLIANAQVDTFYDLSVNLGNGLLLDGDTPQAITIDVDDLSLMVDSDSIRVKPYTTGNDGILRTHLNPDIVWDNKGVGFDTAHGLYARIDNSTVGYDGSGNLEVPLYGITGDRLNTNVADNTKGLEVNSEKLIVKVDGTTIDFDGSGQLTVLSSLPNNLTGITVNDNGVSGNTVRDEVILRLNEGAGIQSSISAVTSTDYITMEVAVDTAWLTAQIDARIALGAGTIYWGTLGYSSGDSTTIEGYITSLNHVVKDTWYNNTQINTTNGLVLRSVGGNTFKVIVDDQGNLDTVSVVL